MVIYTGKSDIHGIGLFSSIPIKKGEKIIEYEGEVMTLKEFKEKYGQYKYNSLNTYIMKRQNKIIVAKEEPYKTINLINYINESSSPNCILKSRWLVATKDIDKCEELTLKYPKTYFRNYILSKVPEEEEEILPNVSST
jgi:SET domain-containing protein